MPSSPPSERGRKPGSGRLSLKGMITFYKATFVFVCNRPGVQENKGKRHYTRHHVEMNKKLPWYVVVWDFCENVISFFLCF